MKLIIKIPEGVKQAFDNGGESNNLLGNAIKNGILIPDNATNGDVIKVMFPNAEYKIIRKMSGMDYVEIHGMSTYGFSVTIDLEWWNAPYERRIDETCD